MTNPRYKIIFSRKGKLNTGENIVDGEAYNYIKMNAKDVLEKYYPEYL